MCIMLLCIYLPEHCVPVSYTNRYTDKTHDNQQSKHRIRPAIIHSMGMLQQLSHTINLYDIIILALEMIGSLAVFTL